MVATGFMKMVTRDKGNSLFNRPFEESLGFNFRQRQATQVNVMWSYPQLESALFSEIEHVSQIPASTLISVVA
jgi:hypothetical protein